VSSPAVSPPAPAGAVADSALDAVSELLADRTWAEVRMADVAERAGVSRQTLYNVFGTREGLAQAYVNRESDAFLTALEHVITTRAEEPIAALAAALEIFLAAAETHPLVRAISASDQGDELLTLVTTRGGPVIGRLTDRLADLIAETWAGVDPAKARLLADTLIRLAISHAGLPGAEPERTAEAVATTLGPFIEQELAEAGLSA
jgi:AcrR family transcriptional regulator